MHAAGLVKLDPVADGGARVLNASVAVAVNALLFLCPDDALDRAIPLRARGVTSPASDQGRVMVAGEE